jgi:hypothetical protein
MSKHDATAQSRIKFYHFKKYILGLFSGWLTCEHSGHTSKKTNNVSKIWLIRLEDVQENYHCLLCESDKIAG